MANWSAGDGRPGERWTAGRLLSGPASWAGVGGLLRGPGLRFAVCAALVLLAAGCDDDDDNVGEDLDAVGDGSVGAPGSPAAVRRELERLDAAFCQAYGECCPRLGVTFSQANCVRLLGFNRSRLETLVQSGKVAFDAAAAQACLRELPEGDVCVSGDPEACQRVFAGRVAPGGACRDGLECAPPPGAGDVECSEDGVCVVVARGVAGDRCVATCLEEGAVTSCWGPPVDEPGVSCYENDGLHCADESLTCVAYPQRGEACGASGTCASGDYCASETETCEALLADGAPCSWGPDCESGRCEGGACTPARGEGEACERQDECGRGGWCEEGRCDASEGDLGAALVCSLFGEGD